LPSADHHTFDKACAQWRDLENIWTPLGWPDHIQNFNILWNGTVMGMPDLSARSRKWAGQGIRVTPIPAWPGWVGYSTGGWVRDDNSVKQGWESGPRSCSPKTSRARSARRSLPNLLRAMAQMAKIMLTRPLDLKRWESENGMPKVDGEDCVDAAEWNRTHTLPNAFGVAQGLSSVERQVSA